MSNDQTPPPPQLHSSIKDPFYQADGKKATDAWMYVAIEAYILALHHR